MSNHTYQSPYHWKRGFYLSLPIAMGYLPAGIAFGVLAQVAEIPIWATLMLSIILYSGTAQYACLPMFSSGVPIPNMAINVFAINLRHMFYALPLLEQLPTSKLARTYCYFALTDEAYSVLTSIPAETRAPIIFPLSLFNQIWWVLATLIGCLLGTALNDLVPHLDFALVCLFVILAYEQFQTIKRFYPILIAIVAFALALFFIPEWRLLISISISMFFIVLLSLLHKPANPNQSSTNP